MTNNGIHEKLCICRKCGGNACHEAIMNDITYWWCIGCGFTSNTLQVEGSGYIKEIEETLPELYKDLRFVDVENLVWYPSVTNKPELGIVFAEGSNKDNWKWAGVKAVLIKDEEKEKFPVPGKKDTYHTHKIDMTTKKLFEQGDFMDSIEYIGLFGNQE